jgi:hypothetical protein
VIHEIPEKIVLVSENCNSYAEGSKNRNDREILLLCENDDNSQLEMLISVGKTGT